MSIIENSGNSDSLPGWVLLGTLGLAVTAAAMHYACLHTEKGRDVWLDDYFSDDLSSGTRYGPFLMAPIAWMFTLWFLGALATRLSDPEVQKYAATAFFVSSVVPFIMMVWRTWKGPPNRAKPQWLIVEEQRRRDAATGRE